MIAAMRGPSRKGIIPPSLVGARAGGYTLTGFSAYVLMACSAPEIPIGFPATIQRVVLRKPPGYGNHFFVGIAMDLVPGGKVIVHPGAAQTAPGVPIKS